MSLSRCIILALAATALAAPGTGQPTSLGEEMMAAMAQGHSLGRAEDAPAAPQHPVNPLAALFLAVRNHHHRAEMQHSVPAVEAVKAVDPLAALFPKLLLAVRNHHHRAEVQHSVPAVEAVKAVDPLAALFPKLLLAARNHHRAEAVVPAVHATMKTVDAAAVERLFDAYHRAEQAALATLVQQYKQLLQGRLRDMESHETQQQQRPWMRHPVVLLLGVRKF